MTIDTNDMLNSILESLSRISYIKLEDIPNIDLYMDQVTTFMNSHLASSKRNPDDKILTKTMINNYAKNQLLPPPEKKKYSKEHQLLLIFIYYFKNILSIQDIQDLLFPITRDFFHPGKDSGDYDIKSIYQEVFSLEKGQIEFLKQDIIDKFKHAQETFPEAEAKDQEFLRTFSFVCMLSFDVYVKKMIIEKLIDSLPKENGKDKK
ncbi:DUF1836 domain-containing protein [Diplocloster agilis]|uniref:DUF1836 domain-containing protein n=1 Tax=Diplocloster agilis TaxID=2850323 RepID=UPI0008213720|nr:MULTISPECIES: DUF1836 domain-containing protein [Lachnospiraceae]MBU9746363.1 DUF1836 domain-containing protein [Diplocloster agilis]MCU6734022.1 DUF1836 domain-containing protein [Suonthocola fibrivorans]SCJ19676.1 Domain of uncharacterised function (DUF1836) [uncultured Clostridium sp.]